ncbi:Pyridoxal-dependent decarboxylase domain-containing protein 1 [Galemys pyrenaicus]|uniref:Pyridoxal-dependent decarboxylase domain-containing protein 1 n=1 Tax=Galemys pyrenaicus TaxID=202257 RepID=A0A8J6A623_GALPY|nr:Pyridoxal-dependent decarboxylase domain-containing protein 1 [Galemys pyrenaicus]
MSYDVPSEIADPTLAEMGKNLKEAMKMLEDSQRRPEEENGKRLIAGDIPGPLQSSGQDMVSILQLVQNLMHGDEEEEPQSTRIQSIGEQGHIALLGHSLGAYISTLDKEKLRKLTTRILSDTTLWLCRIFRYENGCAYFHEEEREGLAKICRLAIHSRYEDFVVDGFNVLYNKKPVIYLSAAARPGLGQYLCNQDVALLEKLIKDDIERGKLPLLLVANAGTAAVGHTDKIGRLKELCEQYGIWLHVEGVNLATLALGYVSSSVLAATKCDSMTLTPGPWLGLPAVPAVTLYRHDDPALTLVAGLTSNKPADKLRALPLWLALQYLGLDGIVERIKHACQLSQRLQESLKKVSHIKILVEDELSSPVVVFRFSQELPGSVSDPGLKAVPAPNMAPSAAGRERHCCDALNRWLGEQLKQLVPASGLTVMDLEAEGVCLRFSPLMTAAGTRGEDVEQLAACVQSKLPVLTCTLQLREEFKRDVMAMAGLLYVDDPNWPGIGVVRYGQGLPRDASFSLLCEEQGQAMLYEHANDDKNSLKLDPEGEKIHAGLLKKLNELESDLTFKMGPEYKSMKSCIYIGMASDDVDVTELVETIAVTAREIEENSRLLENMTEVVRKGIQEAQVQLQKANEERLLEEGVLRQIPVVGSVLNWFSPVQASQKGRTFNLTAGSLESTEHTYIYKVQGTGVTPPPTPSGTRTKQRLPGQKPFKKPLRGSADALSETSSVSHVEDLEKEHLSVGPEQAALEANGPEPHPEAPTPQEAEQTGALPNRAQHPEDDHPQVEELESLR